jgi:hypothetical protein
MVSTASGRRARSGITEGAGSALTEQSSSGDRVEVVDVGTTAVVGGTREIVGPLVDVEVGEGVVGEDVPDEQATTIKATRAVTSEVRTK